MDRDSHVRALVVTGSWDLGANPFDEIARLRDVQAALRACNVPLVVAISGPVSATGALLALAGDWLLAEDSVRFNALSTALDVGEAMWLPWLLPPAMSDASVEPQRSIPPSLTSRQAAAWGLVNEVTAQGQLRARAVEVAWRLAQGPTLALVAARRLVDAAYARSFAAQYRAELDANRVLRESADGREGVRAFLEKRRARFRGS